MNFSKQLFFAITTILAAANPTVTGTATENQACVPRSIDNTAEISSDLCSADLTCVEKDPPNDQCSLQSKFIGDQDADATKNLFKQKCICAKPAVNLKKSAIVKNNLDENTHIIILSFDNLATIESPRTFDVTLEEGFEFVGDVKSELLLANGGSSKALDTQICPCKKNVVKITDNGSSSGSGSIAISAKVEKENKEMEISVTSFSIDDSELLTGGANLGFKEDSPDQKAFDWGMAVAKSKIGLLTSTKYMWKDIIVGRFLEARNFVQESVNTAYDKIADFFDAAYEMIVEFLSTKSKSSTSGTSVNGAGVQG